MGITVSVLFMGSVVTKSLNPQAVIASHKRPGNDDNPQIIDETRQYIRDFDRLAETTTTAQELYDKIRCSSTI